MRDENFLYKFLLNIYIFFIRLGYSNEAKMRNVTEMVFFSLLNEEDYRNGVRPPPHSYLFTSPHLWPTQIGYVQRIET